MSETNSESLFPVCMPYNQGKLKVSDLHTLYYEECGNPSGVPVVYLHGGPGGGISPVARRYFDPGHYRIILFDQRGCGQSTPHAELTDNTTWHLVADIEKLRENLGVKRWHVFGGSWGSTLALAYAETHPENVISLALRGLFTLRRAELEWFYQEGASWLFPDAWEGFLAPIPENERGDMIAAYYKRLTSDDANIRLHAAHAWSIWEGSTLSLRDDPERVAKFGMDAYALAFARIECHYFMHGGFFRQDGQLIADLHKIRHIPTVLVQGRYDACTPMKTAWDIHKAWPEAELVVCPTSGHAMTEPEITAALVRATEKFKSLTA